MADLVEQATRSTICFRFQAPEWSCRIARTWLELGPSVCCHYSWWSVSAPTIRHVGTRVDEERGPW